MHQVVVPKKAQKDLAKIPKEYRLKVIIAFQQLAKNPFGGKKLAGREKGRWSYRVWPYRIIYEIYSHKLVVLVVRIGYRQSVY